MLFIYAVHRMDPVFMLGQGMGLLIYSRNIYFIWNHKKNSGLLDDSQNNGENEPCERR